MQAKHRILYVVGQLGGGGLERQLWYLLSTMDREKYSPGVAVWNLDPSAPYVSKLQSLGVSVYAMPRERGAYLNRAWSLRKLVREVHPEVLHSYSFHTNFAAWCAASAQGRRTIPIGSLRNEYLAERLAVGRIGGALCSRFPDWLIVNSDNAMRGVESSRGWSRPRKVAFVPNGIAVGDYSVLPFPGYERFEIAGIGRLYPQKRWEDLLLALSEFSSRAGRAWRLRLCGGGPLEPDLRLRAKELGIAECVEFLGFQTDVAGILASSHVLALSSGYEGTPNVVLEALACGRPVVATAAGDVARLVREGEHGFVVPVGDTKALACRLHNLCDNPALSQQMGRAGRIRAEEMDLSALLANTFGVYRQAGWKDGG